MSLCTAACWTPVPCPVCGRNMPPRGRSAPMDYACSHEDAHHGPENKRHLWHEHDSDRAYVDPEGWAAHVGSCQECAGEATP